MAKQTLNLNRVDSTTTSNVTPGSGNTALILKTGGIAYKIDTGNSDWKKMLDPQKASNAPANQPLIGLQVKFNKGTVKAPEITQLCFDINPSDGTSYFIPGACSIVLEDSAAYDILEKPDSADKTILYAELSPTTSAPAAAGTNLYKQLDGYEDIDFVFFPLDQLSAMTDLYKCLIISGSKISPGRKLSHRPQALTADKIYEEDYFSLKIEGSEPTSGWGSQNATGPQEAGAAMLPGHPCPPDWQLFTAMMGAVYSKVSNSGVVLTPTVRAAIRRSFNTQVVNNAVQTSHA